MHKNGTIRLLAHGPATLQRKWAALVMAKDRLACSDSLAICELIREGRAGASGRACEQEPYRKSARTGMEKKPNNMEDRPNLRGRPLAHFAQKRDQPDHGSCRRSLLNLPRLAHEQPSDSLRCNGSRRRKPSTFQIAEKTGAQLAPYRVLRQVVAKIDAGNKPFPVAVVDRNAASVGFYGSQRMPRVVGSCRFVYAVFQMMQENPSMTGSSSHF